MSLGKTNQFDTWTGSDNSVKTSPGQQWLHDIIMAELFWFLRCWTIKRKCNLESTKNIILLNKKSEAMIALGQVNSVAQWCYQGSSFFSPFYSSIFSIVSGAQFTAFMGLDDVRVAGVICPKGGKRSVCS